MSVKKNKLIFNREEYSFFDDLITLLGSLSSYMFMADTTRRGHATAINNPKHPFEMVGIANDIQLCFSPFELLNSLANDEWPSSVVFFIDLDYDRQEVFKLQSDKHKSLISRIIESSFIRYYESYSETISSKFGDVQKWPSIWNFARVVRNAFVHNGKIDIRNPNAVSVQWEDLSYNYSDNGRKVLFQDLALADIILLMIEMDNEIKD